MHHIAVTQSILGLFYVCPRRKSLRLQAIQLFGNIRFVYNTDHKKEKKKNTTFTGSCVPWQY